MQRVVLNDDDDDEDDGDDHGARSESVVCGRVSQQLGSFVSRAQLTLEFRFSG